LLKNPLDEKIFNYYATSQVEFIPLDGAVRALGQPGVIESASPSPDGRYVLVDERHPPYSYLLPYPFFPERVSVIDRSTGGVGQIVDKPLADTIPNVHDAVEPGPRDFGWRSDVAATLAYAEAGDGGDPRKEATVRDTVFLLDAPFDGKATKLVELPVRFRSITWADGRLAFVEEQRWKDRKRITLAVAPDKPGAPVQLFDGSFEDRYHDPGTPFTAMNASGKQVLEPLKTVAGFTCTRVAHRRKETVRWCR
jgi:dipeptidyl aminopeptidase/acylaminoacyl peptidase